MLTAEKKQYLVVTDYVPNDGSADVSDALQKLIDENPHRTLYFPDGIYLLAKPILTPAHPEKSVCLSLSNYAILKATSDWSDCEAMIRLGGKDGANNIEMVGSNYFLEGGVVDGSGVARGISIDNGRETVVRNVSIKNTKIGLHIKFGTNCGSSDCDIFNVNIVGAKTADSIGVLVEGHDNSFTNMRIANVLIGLDIRSGGNLCKNLHPLFTLDFSLFDQSCGFFVRNGSNFFENCYADNFCVSFREAANVRDIYQACFCFWYSSYGEQHIAFQSDGTFDSIVNNYRVGFRDNESKNIILKVAEEGGEGIFDNIFTYKRLISDDSHVPYLQGKIVDIR